MSSPVVRTYTAHGYRLSVYLETDGFARTADQTVRYHGFRPLESSESTADLSIRITGNIRFSVPDAAEHILTHPSGVELKRFEQNVFLVRGDAVMRVDPGTGDAVAMLPESAAHEMSFTVDSTLYLFLTFGLVLILQARDLFVLHAAALSPVSSSGILVVAPSGSGKSTLAMRLIESGWKFVSDDSILVRESEEGVIAYPFRRDATVFKKTLAEYRHAAAHSRPLFSDDSKSLVDMDSAYPGRRLESMRPSILLFPSITGLDSTRVESMDPASAMVGLVGQASFLAADSSRVSRQMSVLKQLVEQTRHVRIEAGTDLRHDPHRADSLLSGLLNNDESRS